MRCWKHVAGVAVAIVTVGNVFFIRSVVTADHNGVTWDSASGAAGRVSRASRVGKQHSGSRAPSGSSSLGHDQCRKIEPYNATIDSDVIFPTLGFRENWIYTRSFWNEDLEKRYNGLRTRAGREYPLKIVVVPHSHNDPGWLKTFDAYFQSHTKAILDNVVEKLVKFPQMRFIWSEISFLAKWWEGASGYQQESLKSLVRQGRLEIVTGGWVMADEATVNLYSLVDQLIEGQQWVQRNLGVSPKFSWSVDPFGHGATVPFVLKRSGMEGMVIQRVHYAWKKWFATHQAGDFEWVQRWDKLRKNTITCHNAPFDIYSIQHSCGPDPNICKNFDFREIPGEFRELWSTSVPINDFNMKEKAELLLEQYAKTASLFPHNVALIALGNDFRFEKPLEWDQQFLNYKKLFDYINRNRATYRADVRFGTVSDYFKVVSERSAALPTFSGDFFPYSDIFSSGWPGYWTGFYGTRPYWKKLYRETENELRSAEILYSFGYNAARQRGGSSYMEVLEAAYGKLVKARRWLALFAHHDATTGTSREATMDDYREKLEKARTYSQEVQNLSAMSLLRVARGSAPPKLQILTSNMTLHFTRHNPANVVIFNSLPWRRVQPIRLTVSSPYVKVVGPRGRKFISQVNPVFSVLNGTMIQVSGQKYELIFVAVLPALSLTTFQIRRAKQSDQFRATLASIHCYGRCGNPGPFSMTSSLQGVEAPVLRNDRMKLQFYRATGMLAEVHMQNQSTLKLNQEFGAYASYWGGSGAYLFKPDLWTDRKPEIPFNGTKPLIASTLGPISSELALFQDPIAQRTRIYLRGDLTLREAIFIENTVDLGDYDAEIYLRFNTDLDSTTRSSAEPDGPPVPTFYTDQNGFAMEKRAKALKLGLEGNYYPVNTMTFIQDERTRSRVSVLVDRAHGFSSFEKGRLETLIERRTPYDDGRGMQEGVKDNRRTTSNYVVLLERANLSSREPDYRDSLPTKKAYTLSQQLNYLPIIFHYSAPSRRRSAQATTITVPLLSHRMPPDSHMLNLRTLSENNINGQESPSDRALLVLQKTAFNCAGPQKRREEFFYYQGTKLNYADVNSIERVGLTGVGGATRSFNNLSDIPAQVFDLTSVLLSFR